MRKWLRDPVPEIPEIPQIPTAGGQPPVSDPARPISGICGISGRGGRPEDDRLPEGSALALHHTAPIIGSSNITGYSDITSSFPIITSSDISGYSVVAASFHIFTTIDFNDYSDITSGLIGASADITGFSGPIGTSADTGFSGTITLRRPQEVDWSTADWLVYFDEKAGIGEHDHGLARPEAEARALDFCVGEWLSRNPVHSDPDDGCPICGDADRPNDPLLAIGIAGAGQVWLHRGCSAAWRTARVAEATAALASMGINGPEGSST